MSDHYPDGRVPSHGELVSVLREVAATLAEAGTEHVFMGGVGEQPFRERETDDIDLFVRPAEAPAVLRALAAAGFRVEVADETWLGKAWKRGVLVDVIFRSAGGIHLDDDMLARSTIETYEGAEMRVISPEDMVVIKAHAATEKTPHHWYDALALLRCTALDWRYLVARARAAGPHRVLSLLLYAESAGQVVPSEATAELLGAVHPAEAA